MFLCEFKIISARISVAHRLAPSYRSCFVAVPVLQQAIILFLHSHDRHASSCLVAAPVINLALLFKTLQGICYCIQDYFCNWSSQFRLFPNYFSGWSPRCELFCHCTAIRYFVLCYNIGQYDCTSVHVVY